MTDFAIPERPCVWCSRFVGHFGWCPDPWVWCSCNRVVPPHKFGMNYRCMYVNDSADDDNRLLRGLSISAKQLVGVAECHWPNPVTETIVMRTAGCPHGTHPWEHAA